MFDTYLIEGNAEEGYLARWLGQGEFSPDPTVGERLPLKVSGQDQICEIIMVIPVRSEVWAVPGNFRLVA